MSTLNPSIHQSINPVAAAVIYGRVSTSQQATTAQEARCKEYLPFKRLALAGDGEFYDDDISGSIAMWERPNGRRLRARLAAGDVKHLIVAKLDRLGRSAIDLLQTLKLLDALGVVLHIVDLGGDSLSTQGASGRLMFTVLAGMAEYERELIRSRIQDKLNLKLARGELAGTVPYGFEAVETGEATPKGVKVRRLVDNPEEQKWILWMRGLRQAGHGYHTIAKRLNELGVPTKRRGELLRLLHGSVRKVAGDDPRFPKGQWQAGNVRKVLVNKTVQTWLATHDAAQASQQAA